MTPEQLLIKELVNGLVDALAVIEANWEVIRPIMEDEEHEWLDNASEALAHGSAHLSSLHNPRR